MLFAENDLFSRHCPVIALQSSTFLSIKHCTLEVLHNGKGI